MNSQLSRRQLIKGSVIAAAAVLVAGMWDRAIRPFEWRIPDLSRLSPGGELDLRSTLPLPYRLSRAGFFGVDPSGAPLPEGITLTRDGRLRVSPEARSLTVSGVVFSFSVDGA